MGQTEEGMEGGEGRYGGIWRRIGTNLTVLAKCYCSWLIAIEYEVSIINYIYCLPFIAPRTRNFIYPESPTKHSGSSVKRFIVVDWIIDLVANISDNQGFLIMIGWWYHYIMCLYCNIDMGAYIKWEERKTKNKNKIVSNSYEKGVQPYHFCYL